MPDVTRNLTIGELRYATEVFGAALDARKVRIHNTRAYFFQPSDTAMTPDGEVYFPLESYKPDFSSNLSDAAWLIHELTHAWQHQQHMWVRLRAVLNRTYNYGDLRAASRNFLSYSIEQQAAIVSDYFRVKHGLRAVEGQGTLSDYRKLTPFISKDVR